MFFLNLSLIHIQMCIRDSYYANQSLLKSKLLTPRTKLMLYKPVQFFLVLQLSAVPECIIQLSPLQKSPHVSHLISDIPRASIFSLFSSIFKFSSFPLFNKVFIFQVSILFSALCLTELTSRAVPTQRFEQGFTSGILYKRRIHHRAADARDILTDL